MEKRTREALKQDIREHVEGIYYRHVESKTPWQPFEYYSETDVEEIIESDTRYWLAFIEGKIKENT